MTRLPHRQYTFLGIPLPSLRRKQLIVLVVTSFLAIAAYWIPDVYKRQRHARARAALDAVGLLRWEKHTPAELSGGQQQRVAIARAIVTDPTVLLADEPTGNLDSQRSHEIMDLLVALNRDRGITVLMVTHEPEMAHYAKRIIHFRDGRVDTDHRHREDT